MELKRQEVKLFSKSSRDVKNLYLSAFPAVERAPYLPLLLTSYRDLADFYAYYDGDDLVGWLTFYKMKLWFIYFS